MLFGDAEAIAKMVKFLGRYAIMSDNGQYIFNSDVELLHYWK
jgi:hypothetical protein